MLSSNDLTLHGRQSWGRTVRTVGVCLTAISIVFGLLSAPATADRLRNRRSLDFDMVVSAGAKACLPHARAEVHVTSLGPVEVMDVRVAGLPKHTTFDFFVIQVPKAPFGLSWYQGDIDTDHEGVGIGRFVGRFNIETFIVAPGSAPAPVVFDGPFPDASLNPATAPVQLCPLVLCVNSHDDAA